MHSFLNRSINYLLLFALVFATVSLGAQTTTSPAPPAAVSSSPELLIGSGDLLEVSVYDAPDFDKKEVRVSGSGEIALPLIGLVHVAGLNIDAAGRLIAEKLKAGEFFADPQVAVFEKEYATQGASVLGEVMKPGVYPLLGVRHLFDAISMAGGLTPKAGNIVTVTHRNDPGHPEKVTLVNHSEASTEGNIEVQPGDTIVVSKAGIVYVVGDVKLPGGFVMENGKMTLLQAVALAQGANGTAKLTDSKLIRKTADGQETQTPLDLKKVLSAKAPDMTLLPEDIVFIPNSAAKSALRRGLETALQTASGVAIYHP